MAHGSKMCSKEQTKTDVILIGRAPVCRTAGAFHDSTKKGIRQAAVTTCIRICEATNSFPAVPLIII